MSNMYMTLDEAIARERQHIKEYKSNYDKCPTRMRYNCEMCFHKPKCNEIAEYHEQLAERLEDYKKLKIEKEQNIYERAYKDGYDKGLSDGRFCEYNKAIDEFVERLKVESFNGYATLEDYFEDTIECVAIEDINKIAEQLQIGAKKKINNVVELIKDREISIELAIFLSTQGIKCVINDGKVVDFVLE